MSLILYNQGLLELMEHFYILTGIRIACFDESYTEIASYPENEDSFCSCMRKIPDFEKLCVKSDFGAFEKCRKEQTLTVYKCHAGLIEATAPLMDNGVIIGYIMFGQITDIKNKSDFFTQLHGVWEKYSEDNDIFEKAKKIRYKSNRRIVAAAKILDACTSYIMLKEMVKPSKKQLLSDIERYIDNNLDKKISVESLCREFNISRTCLYELMGKQVSRGIASFIRQKRMSHAKKLLKSTDMSVAQIASAIGFDDYNYFLRVFKSTYGISPTKIRKTHYQK